MCYWTLEVRDTSILKILWKVEKLPFSFPQYFFYLLLDFHVKAGTRFSLRDKWLFEISEVEIPRVNCIYFVYRTVVVHMNIINTIKVYKASGLPCG